MTDQFVGRGWAFPLRIDTTGSLALTSGQDEIAESIRIILSTSVGERPMRPEFGSHLADYVFSRADESTAAAIAADVSRSLERWEPRIRLTSVDATLHPDDPTVILIEIEYAIRASNDPRNLVFPFYVIPEEE